MADVGVGNLFVEDDGDAIVLAPVLSGGNCIKICLAGKLILSKRKRLREVLFS